MKYETFHYQTENNKELPVYVMKDPTFIDGKVIERGIIYCGNEVIDDMVEFHGPNFKKYWFLICTTQSHIFGDSPLADLHLFSNPDLIADYLQSPAKNVPHLLLGCGHYVDPTLFFPENITKEFDVIYVSKWFPTKRIELVVGASKILGKKIKILVIGINILNPKKKDISLKYKKQIIDEINSENLNVQVVDSMGKGHFNEDGTYVPGGFSKEVIRHFINKSKIAILTADINEGINRSVCEAMCCNLPVIMTNDMLGGTKLLVTDLTGKLSNPNPEDIAQSIQYTLEHYKEYSPREGFLKKYGTNNSMNLLKAKIAEIADSKDEKLSLNELKPYRGDVWSMDYYKSVKNINYL